MDIIAKKLVILTSLLMILSALPASAAEPTKFTNDIFNKDWWTTQPAKFANDIFNPTWWKTQPSKFVNDIFNSKWASDMKSKFVNDIFNSKWASEMKTKFVNDIFNSKWMADRKTNFFNDIFNKIPVGGAVDAIKSALNQMQSGSSQSPTSGNSGIGGCFDKYGTVCYDSCGRTQECIKSCAQQFSVCIKANQ